MQPLEPCPPINAPHAPEHSAPTVVREVAALLTATLPARRVLVGIDGVDGSGKTTFTAYLASVLSTSRRQVIVIHEDDFLNVSEVRHARGRHSPEGFWLDSYDEAALDTHVLSPLGSGDGVYRSKHYDLNTDRTVEADDMAAAHDAVVLVEGMFLHRPSVADAWDVSVFLDVPFTETVRRMAARDGSPANPEHPKMRRYVEGQRLYFANVRPWERATVVVDNTDPERGRVIAPDEACAARNGVTSM